jgi:DnaJ-class molecular chaperone
MNLTLDDLMEPCTICGGSGKQPPSTDPQQQGGGYGMRIVSYPLSDGCDACQGTGGGVLTPLGEVLKEFLVQLQKKHLI